MSTQVPHTKIYRWLSSGFHPGSVREKFRCVSYNFANLLCTTRRDLFVYSKTLKIAHFFRCILRESRCARLDQRTSSRDGVGESWPKSGRAIRFSCASAMEREEEIDGGIALPLKYLLREFPFLLERTASSSKL